MRASLSIFMGLALLVSPHQSSCAATLAGKEARGGATLDIQFPIPSDLQALASQGGNPRPTTGRASVMFPNGFDPAKTWPILVITSTTDVGRTNILDAPAYRDTATKEGWIVFATDATIQPSADSLAWRVAPLTAGLQFLRSNWPQSARWPVGFAGFSGGAKRAGIVAAMLAENRGLRICGLFLAGINSDRVTAAYKDYHPPADFLNVPIWISSGMSDPIATPGLSEGVYFSLKRTGFKNVRLEKFFGGHMLKKADLQRALHWFREVGKF
jgi:pimeloyl-ACP methyl ester carboxylesterase